MNRRSGVVGIAVLWILAALSAMAMAGLAAGRLEMSRGRAQLEETRAMALLSSAFRMAKEGGFRAADGDYAFQTGRVQMERLTAPESGMVRVRCVATVGLLEKKVETGWRRAGGGWRAVYWREL